MKFYITVLQVKKFNFKLILTPYFLLIFSAVLFSTLSDQFLQNQVEKLISSKDGLSNMIWFWGSLTIANAVFFPLLISFLCAYTLIASAESTQPEIDVYFRDNFELEIIETMRSWGKAFLWGFVFIIPGFVRYVNYMLTPFVVAFSKKYKKGEVDALEYSTRITKTFIWSLQLWLAVFYVVIPALSFSLFDDYRIFAHHPFAATGITFVDALVELLFHFLILRHFVKFLNEHENDPSPETENILASEVENAAHV